MEKFKAIDAKLSKFFNGLAYAGGIITALMMALSALNVITRSIFNSPIYGTVEIMGYSALLVAALTLSQHELDDGNPTMTLVLDNLKPRANACFKGFSELISAGFFGCLTYKFCTDIFTAVRKMQYTAVVHIPMSIIYAILFFGFLCLTLATLLKLVRTIIFIASYKATGNEKTAAEQRREEFE